MCENIIKPNPKQTKMDAKYLYKYSFSLILNAKHNISNPLNTTFRLLYIIQLKIVEKRNISFGKLTKP